MKKLLLIVVIVSVVAVTLGNLFQNKFSLGKTAFAEQIEKANQLCPIDLPYGVGAVTSITIENGFVIYNICYNREFCNIMQLLDKEKQKEVFLMACLINNAQGKNNGDQFINMLIEEGCGLKYVINDSLFGPFECSISVDEIISMRQRYILNPHVALQNVLQLTLEAEKTALPVIIEDGMAITDCLLEDNNIVFIVSCDEELYSMDSLNFYKSDLKSFMLENAKSDAQSYMFLGLCKMSHTGLVWRYVGMQSQETCDIVLSSYEINQEIQTPPNLNIH